MAVTKAPGLVRFGGWQFRRKGLDGDYRQGPIKIIRYKNNILTISMSWAARSSLLIEWSKTEVREIEVVSRVFSRHISNGYKIKPVEDGLCSIYSGEDLIGNLVSPSHRMWLDPATVPGLETTNKMCA